MRGMAKLKVGSFSRENLEKAIGDFDQALRLDPDNPQALAYKAMARIALVTAYGLGGNFREVLKDAEQAADRVARSTPR